jgi:hypothetical protein
MSIAELHAEGTVIGYLEHRKTRKSHGMFSPVVQFIDPLGMGSKILVHPRPMRHFAYSIGETVDVFVHPQKQDRARLGPSRSVPAGRSSRLPQVLKPGGGGWLGSLLLNMAYAKTVNESDFDRSQLIDENNLDGYLKKIAKSAKITAAILRTVGGGLIIASVFMGQKTLQFINSAQRAQGVIVEKAEKRSSKGGRTYYPIIEFQGPQTGQAIRFRHNFGTSMPSWQVGDNVNVLYNPNEPQDAIMEDGVWNWFVPGMFMAVGLFFIFVGQATSIPKRHGSS